MPMAKRESVVGFGHMEATKGFLVGCVQRFGAKTVVENWDGTDDELIAEIWADSREVIAMGCDHYDEKGHCLGHDRK